MRISVYLEEQDHQQDCALHETSRRIAGLLVAMDVARIVGQNAIQLKTDLTWKEAKSLTAARHRSTRNNDETQDVWSLLPPLDWYYPWTSLPEWMLRSYRQHARSVA